MNHRANRRVFNANRSHHPRQRAEPVSSIDHVCTGDAGEKIFRTTREPNHLMREDWAKNKDMIVFERGFVDADIYFIRQGRMPVFSSNLLDLVLPNNTERCQFCRRIPLVIKQTNILEGGVSFFGSNTNQ